MALIAGAGNPTSGSNPSGTSQGLVYLGNNKYAAWSGTQIATNGADATLFDFVTPADASIMAEFTYMVDDADLGDGNTIGFNMEINGETIGKVVDNSGEARTLGTLLVPLRIALPSQSRIVIKGTTNDSSNITVSGVIIGEGA